MLKARSLEIIKKEGYDINDHSYKVAIAVNGVVECIMDCNELLARVIATPHQMIFIEDGQLSVGDSYPV
jgi:ribonucleotide reductase alpha subunit